MTRRLRIGFVIYFFVTNNVVYMLDFALILRFTFISSWFVCVFTKYIYICECNIDSLLLRFVNKRLWISDTVFHIWCYYCAISKFVIRVEPSRLLFAVSPAPCLKRLDTQNWNAELHMTDSINIPYKNNIKMYKYCEILICTNIVKSNWNKDVYMLLFLSSNCSRDFQVALEHSTQLMRSIAIGWLFAAPFGHLSRWRYAGASVLRCITLLSICTTTRQTISPSGL